MYTKKKFLRINMYLTINCSLNTGDCDIKYGLTLNTLCL